MVNLRKNKTKPIPTIINKNSLTSIASENRIRPDFSSLETNSLALGEKFAARRKNLENDIRLLMKRYPEPKCCKAILLLRERLAKISEKEVG